MRYLVVLLILAAIAGMGLKTLGLEWAWIDPCWPHHGTRNAYIPEGC